MIRLKTKLKYKYLARVLFFILLFFTMDNILSNSYENIIDSLYVELSTTQETEKLSEICKSIGDNYYQINRDSIYKYYELSTKYANQTETHIDDVSILRSYGYLNTNLEVDYTKALEYYEEAYDISVQNNDDRNIAMVLNDIGIVSWKKGDYQKAIEFHFTADDIASKLDDADLRMRTLLSLGVIYNEGLRNEEAKDCYLTALPLAESIGHIRAKGVILNNLGKAYRDLEDYQESPKYFEQALEIFKEMGNEYWKGLVYYNMGYTCFLKGEYKKAIDLYDLSIKSNKITQIKDREVMIILGLAETYAASKQSDKAIQASLKGLKLLKDIDTKRYHNELNLILAQCYERKRDFKKSSFYFQKNLNDALETKTQQDKLVKVKALYENERKESEINILEIKNQDEINKRERAYYLSRLSLIGFLLGLAVFGLLFYRYKLNQYKKYDFLKTKLTNDLHDNIGSSLSQIKRLSNRIRPVEGGVGAEQSQPAITKIKAISNDLIGNMHDLIWSIDQDKEKLEDLLNRMRDHTSNIFSPLDIPFLMKINNENENINIDAEIKNNIYALFKEAVNNIVKHTEPCNISIRIDVSNNRFKLSLKNDKNKLISNGYSNKKGLFSMQERAKAIGGTLDIKNEDDLFLVNLEVRLK